MDIVGESATGGGAWLGELEQIEREAKLVQEAVAETTGTAEAADGLVRATVGARGELRELLLDPRIYRELDADALATQICAAVNEAALRAQEQACLHLKDLVPRGAVPGEVDLAFEPFLYQLEQLKGGRTG